MGIPLDRYTEQLGEVSHETLRNPLMPDMVGRYYRQPGTYQTNGWCRKASTS
jgi:signal peptidase I